MVMISSRFLAVLLIAVVAVSLLGSMLGYAIGARGQRQGLGDALAAFHTGPAASSRASDAAAAPATPSPAVPPAQAAADTAAQPQPEATPAPPELAPVADSAATTDLPVGTAAAKGGVAVTMTDAQVGKWEEGVEVRLQLTNTSGHDLHFFFTPERSVHMQDSRGATLNLRWAEYDGEITLPDGQRRNLLRAFFQGETHHPNVDHVTLLVDELPNIGAASWQAPIAGDAAP